MSGTVQQKVRLKWKLGDDMRALSVASDIAYAELVARLSASAGCDVRVEYYDADDLIAIRSDADWAEAVDFAATSSGGALKIRLTAATSSTPSGSPSLPTSQLAALATNSTTPVTIAMPVRVSPATPLTQRVSVQPAGREHVPQEGALGPPPVMGERVSPAPGVATDANEHDTVPAPPPLISPASVKDPSPEDAAEDTLIRLREEADGTDIKWKKGSLLGKGAFGEVYLAMVETGGFVAVKQVRLEENIKADEADQLRKEINLLKRLDHPNVVRYIGSSIVDTTLNIFMEYVPGGTIASNLRTFGPFEESVVRVYVRQMLQGLVYLHSFNIIHRDIKGANILLDKTGTVKLADFGASKLIVAELQAAKSAQCQSFRGTPYWMAPEVIKQTGYGRKADIWSVGATVFEMATARPPWSQFTALTAIFQIAKDDASLPIVETLSADGQDFMRQCMQRNPKLRADAETLLRHPFVADMGAPEAPARPPRTTSFTPASGRSPPMELRTPDGDRRPSSPLHHDIPAHGTRESPVMGQARHALMTGATLERQRRVSDSELLAPSHRVPVTDVVSLPTSAGGGKSIHENEMAWLWIGLDEQRQSLTGHDGPVHCIKFDGARLVTGSSDCTIKVWAGNGLCMRTLRGHDHGVLCLDFDESLMLSGSSDGTIRVWDMQTSQCMGSLGGHSGAVTTVELEESGATAVSGSLDSTVRLWNTASRECLWSNEAHAGGVHCVQHRDGSTLVTGGADNKVKVWDLGRRECVHVLEGHTGKVLCLQYRSELAAIVSGSSDATVRVWSTASWKCTETVKNHGHAVNSVQFDSHKIVGASSDGTVVVWKLLTGESIHTLRVHTRSVLCVRFRGTKLISASEDGTAVVIDFEDERRRGPQQESFGSAPVAGVDSEGLRMNTGRSVSSISTASSGSLGGHLAYTPLGAGSPARMPPLPETSPSMPHLAGHSRDWEGELQAPSVRPSSAMRMVPSPMTPDNANPFSPGAGERTMFGAPATLSAALGKPRRTSSSLLERGPNTPQGMSLLEKSNFVPRSSAPPLPPGPMGSHFS